MVTRAHLTVVASILALALVGRLTLARAEHEEPARTDAKDGAPAPTNAVTVTFRVIGMHCPGCEERVRNALHRVNGIFKVDVKIADHRVVVSFDKDKVSA